MRNLLEYLPENYHNSTETEDMVQTMDVQMQKLWGHYLDFLDQVQVNTATWGLRFWEEIYGIPIDVSKDVRSRRSAILAKMRISGSITPEVIQNIAAGFSEGETTLEEFCSEYRFRLGIDRNLDSEDIRENFIKAIEESKPAHLIWDYAIRVLCPQKMLHIAGGSYHIAETTLPPLKGVRT